MNQEAKAKTYLDVENSQVYQKLRQFRHLRDKERR